MCCAGPFAEHAGVEVDTQGDAFFVAFPTAPGAAAAALEGLAALEPGLIRVRMGLHTGTPTVTAEGYVGVDVHRVARVAALAHGGQALLTEATSALLDAQATLLDLGRHRLKDFDGPARLLQLGDRDFPPLRTPGTVSLPTPATPFLGREQGAPRRCDGRARAGSPDPHRPRPRRHREDALRARARASPGGGRRGRHAVRPPRDTARRRPRPPRGRRDAGGRKPRAGRHCRTCRREAHPCAARQPRAAPSGGGRAAVSSRRRLAIAPSAGDEPRGGPGGTRDAVRPAAAHRGGRRRLLRRARPRRRFAGRGEPDRRGAQRAPRPASARPRAGRRADTPSRTRDPRHATLRATIEWSYDLPSPREQELFADLAVFRGGCTVEAAEEVCDADLDTLASLIDKSLVRRHADPGGADRYWMLETIREFAGGGTRDLRGFRARGAPLRREPRDLRRARRGARGGEHALPRRRQHGEQGRDRRSDTTSR